MARWTVVLRATAEQTYDVEASSAREAQEEARSGEYTPIVSEYLDRPELVTVVEQFPLTPAAR